MLDCATLNLGADYRAFREMTSLQNIRYLDRLTVLYASQSMSALHQGKPEVDTALPLDHMTPWIR